MNIRTLYESGRLPHAVLFVGGDLGSVEQTVNLHKCDPADTVYVRESMPDEAYKIKPLREIISSGNLRPQFGDTRVFVFTDFDSMSEICQNALLKFIEEPLEFNRFVMTAGTAAKILPTILSRVVVLRSDGAAVGEPSETAEPPQSEVIAKAIIASLKSRSEYDMAAAFSKIKDRQMLSDVLHKLLDELSVIMVMAKSSEKVINATDVLGKYIQRIEVNPNVQVTSAACAAELHTVLRKKSIHEGDS